MPPFFVISEATYPIRRIFRSRCSLENPSSEDKFLRTISPSSKVTGLPPISINLVNTAFAIVDFPDPESPVKNIVKPRFDNGGNVLRSSSSTSGNENQSGISIPSYKRRLSSVPEMLKVLIPLFNSSIGLNFPCSGTYTNSLKLTISIPISFEYFLNKLCAS